MANTQKHKPIKVALQEGLRSAAKPGGTYLMRKGKWKRVGPSWKPNIADLKTMSYAAQGHGTQNDSVVARNIFSLFVAAALRYIGLNKIKVVSVSSWGWPPYGKNRTANVAMKYLGERFLFKITPISSTMYLVSLSYKLDVIRENIALYMNRTEKGDEVTWKYVFRGY